MTETTPTKPEDLSLRDDVYAVFDEFDQKYNHIVMTDVTQHYVDLSGEVEGLMAYLLYNNCSNQANNPEFKGYELFDIELHCSIVRVVARQTNDRNRLEETGPVYQVKAVYVMPS